MMGEGFIDIGCGLSWPFEISTGKRRSTGSGSWSSFADILLKWGLSFLALETMEK